MRKDSTKFKFAQAIKRCMIHDSIDTISVAQIAEESGLSRQTFYRHFLDKYDLINWYFDQLLFESFKEMGKGKTVFDGLVRKFRFIEHEQLFFTVSFQSDSQNSLKTHDYEMIRDFYVDLIRGKTGDNPDESLRFSLEVYCQGAVYKTVDWLEKGMKETPEALAELMIQAMPNNMKTLFIAHAIM